MPFGSNKADYIVWVLLLAAELGLLAAVLRRQAWRRVPVFTGYLLLKILRSVGLLVVGLTQSYSVYFYCYWTATAVTSLAVFPLLWEIFDFSVISFRRCLFVMMGAGLWVLAADPTVLADPLMTVIRTLERFTWIVVIGIFVWAVTLETAGNREKYGIGLGLVVFSTGYLLKSTLATHVGADFLGLVTRIPHAFYPICLCIWFWYVGRRGDFFSLPSAEVVKSHLLETEVSLLCSRS
jgi:hypothetical protein